MLHSRYDSQVCSIARALEHVGERWTLLILRELFLGQRRFDLIQGRLGIARNVLTARLEKLVAEGIVERRPYSERPVRHEYRLTEKGRDLWPVLVALLQWGDRHDAPAGAPVLLRHAGCGGAVDGHRMCDRCGVALEPSDVQALAGPGAATASPRAGTTGAARARSEP